MRVPLRVFSILTVSTVLVLTAAPARAEWFFAHGTAAVLQEDAVANCV